METRKGSNSKSSPLPSDYLAMVKEVFNSHFDEGLQKYRIHSPETEFEVRGEVHSDEVILSVSLVTPNQLAATTVFASSDFDPKASAPTVQEILSACVDAAASMLGSFLTPDQPKKIEQLASSTLASLEEAPIQWTEVESDRKKIFVKMDKSNPCMDAITDDWLRKNDPELRTLEDEEQKATEKLFVTGKKPRSEA